MKKIIYILIVSATILNFGCNPKFDASPDIGELPTGDFSITADDDYNYTFNVTGNSGFLVNWDFGNGSTEMGDEVSSYFPFKKDYEVSCVFTGKGGSTTVTKTVSIDVTDPAVSQLPTITELTDEGAGRTWVYASDRPGWDDGVDPYQPEAYCFMVAEYDWEEFWWDPYDGAEETPDFDAEIRFDLDGDFNFTFYQTNGAQGIKGTFSFNADDNSLKIADSHIPDYEEDNLSDKKEDGVYEIISITDDELIIVQKQNIDDYDWIWIFKRKGYTYP